MVTIRALFFALVVSVVVNTATMAAEQDPNLSTYTIGPEDVLEIVVWKNQDLSRTVSVRPDGMISLPLLNDVHAAGSTPMELRDLLLEKLKEYVAAPEVSVLVTDVKSFKVAVIGEVEQPKRLDLRSRTTVLEALALAGGFKKAAKRDRVVVLRRSGDGVKRIAFNYDEATTADSDEGNFFLHPDDIIIVP